jgi:hypothetical protein
MNALFSLDNNELHKTFCHIVVWENEHLFLKVLYTLGCKYFFKTFVALGRFICDLMFFKYINPDEMWTYLMLKASSFILFLSLRKTRIATHSSHMCNSKEKYFAGHSFTERRIYVLSTEYLYFELLAQTMGCNLLE